jgi:hypothetical protein
MLSKKTKNYSSNICKSSSNLLKTITKPTTYKKYEKYIKDITNKFTDSQNTNTNKLLNEIFTTKNNNQFTFTFTEIPLNNHNCIPPFIDIFRYLITKPEYIDKFTADEQMQLHNNLSKHHTLESCYKFIEKSQIGKKILTYYDSISHNLKTELITKYPSIEFHKLLINKFTSIKIIEDLELRIKKLVCLSVEWQGRKLDNLVYMFMYGDSDDSSDSGDSGDSGGIDYYKNISHSIIERILFFNKFLNIAKLPNKFIIFLSDKKKEIDDDVVLHMHFKTINVNTAVTNGRDIIIYRQQELLKSIFHELIHFHNLDFRQIPNSIIQYLIKTHNIKSDNEYLLYECVTEAMANILNNIFLSSNIKNFIYNLQNEILFSTLQVVKILNVCGYKKWNEFANLDMHSSSTTNNSNPKKQFKQDSCIMSYYILKFYIMMNLDIYFKKCLDTKIKFIQTNESFNNLIHIFDLARKNIYIKEFMDNALRQIGNSKNSNHISNHNRTQKKIKKERTKKTAKQKINKTLRMTCLESNLFIKNSI